MTDRNRQYKSWNMEAKRHPGEVSGHLYSGERLLMHSEEYFHFSYCCGKEYKSIVSGQYGIVESLFFDGEMCLNCAQRNSDRHSRVPYIQVFI